MVERFVVSVVAVWLAGCGPAGPIGVGDDAPTFAIRPVVGRQRVGLPNGKVSVVALGGTYDIVFEKLIPKLQRIHEKHGAARVAVIAVPFDEAYDTESSTGADLLEWGERHGVTFAIGLDPGHRVVMQWVPGGEPSVYVVDREHVVQHVFVRDQVLAPALERSVDALVRAPHD